jgi:hypothetical protein
LADRRYDQSMTDTSSGSPRSYNRDVDIGQLTKQFSALWHVTFAGGWDGIQQLGLLRAIDIAPDRCDELRLEPNEVDGPGGTPIVLRNQLRSRIDPTPYLVKMTPAEWWRLVNSRVYFFCRQADLDTLVGAYVQRGLAQDVIKLRTRRALEDVADMIEVTTVNAGVFPREREPSRGRDTFVPLADYPVSGVAKIREITVATRVPVHSSAVMSVVRHNIDGSRVRVFP